MKKTIIAIVIVLIVGFGIYFITSKNPNNNSETSADAFKNAAQIPVTTTSSDVNVDIKNLLFNPTTLDIKTGTKVTWTNNDSVPHTITSDFDKLLDSTTLSPGQSFSFTFSKAGFINYHCNFHPTMKGIVIVKD